MNDVAIRIEGRAGRITLDRPKALNALTYAMCRDIAAALEDWRDDPAVALVMIDAEGARAFCAGGDIAEMYATGTRGDFDYGRRFWADEYRMNATLADYPKPVVSFLHGFTMGGGVGLGCHAGVRIVGESTRIAMPECGIGLVPDVGGSRLLARMQGAVPGFGAWIGTTGTRMGPGDAILAGFADRFVPEADWPEVKARMVATGAPRFDARPATEPATEPEPETEAGSPGDRLAMAAHFDAGGATRILAALDADDRPGAQEAVDALRRASPLSVAAHLEILRRLGADATVREALSLEYRFTFRAMEHGDFLEGIRAAIIDKDRAPRWRHPGHDAVSNAEVAAMLAPLGPDELTFERVTT